MASTPSIVANALLQDAVSSAAATLFAIEAGDMFRAVPADPAEAEVHNHACFMLSMLERHLRHVQAEVDALAPEPETSKVEG